MATVQGYVALPDEGNTYEAFVNSQNPDIVPGNQGLVLGSESAVFLGATQGQEPLPCVCPDCNYQGHTVIRRLKGMTYALFFAFTFGVAGLCGAEDLKDTHHFCPSCDKHLAYSKFF
mmetsp:Transcript_9215/g.10641  ORF Transcript_9215/g.10641 Transcript_9215/m.10641 type:complete len:117 (+) Transcript_9215:135-485(+)|eukprot:CAMPEP_0197847180 /NCGR_PEP_ID=MMETSP1438-20131217/5403_1 /TAXON_ID=1461541 /ORGANISM="Pterosperma sp., Strain CCMP1384" /LENGTH=116 /DNA_ID=CAMNT_0043459027 /DNA_START=134 /DNA_END=484 /DNA_ORIENTATION=+